VTEHHRQDAERAMTIEKLQSSLMFLHEPVSHFSRGAATCGSETPIRTVAGLMSAQRATAALVQSDSGTILGIVTDSDLRDRVVATGLDQMEPVSRIMTAPVASIPEEAPIYEALLAMQEKGIQHLVITGERGRMLGVVRNKELLQFHRYGAIVLTREVARSATADDVIRCCRRAPDLVRALVECGTRPRSITRILAAVCDAATERLTALAIEETGPPPVPFAFLALGSQGRHEQTIFTDQDNAIVFRGDGSEALQRDAAAYFLQVGVRVCDYLNQAGYPYCQGNVMAKNSKWCQPLGVWKQYFEDWIRTAEPPQLLEFSIFFDFRTVCGDAKLADELRRHVHAAIAQSPAFFPHFAQNALQFKPPIRVFGRILAGTEGGEQGGTLNLKDAMMPIVNFARLYSLRHEIENTNTVDRLAALVERQVLTESSHDETTAAYDILMRLRLEQQVHALATGQQLGNTIALRRVGHIDATLLNQSLAQIAAVQKKISYDFLGGT
jgi:CBS domain-containing protein